MHVVRSFVQPEGGYRANVDATHLARFALAGSAVYRSVVDLGAGAGLVGLTMLDDPRVGHVHFVEVDEETSYFTEENLTTNLLSTRGTVHLADVRAFAEQHRGMATLVVCNPPYVERGKGRAPKSERRALARHGSVEHFVKAARLVAGARARVCFIYPAREILDLFLTFRTFGLEPKRMRLVHAKPGAEAHLVLVEATAGKPGGLLIEPPLVEA